MAIFIILIINSSVMLIIIKVGGSVIRKGIDNFIKEVPELINNGHKVVIIHGGGYFINELMERMGLKPGLLQVPVGLRVGTRTWRP